MLTPSGFAFYMLSCRLFTRSAGIVTSPAELSPFPAGVVTRPAELSPLPADIIARPADVVAPPAAMLPFPAELSPVLRGCDPSCGKVTRPAQGFQAISQKLAHSIFVY